jgi:hypothetical protein
MVRFQFIPRSILAPRSATSWGAPCLLPDLQPRDAHEPPQGPGWFDSSFDLAQGLDVRDAGDRGYDDWLAARAIVERRAAARRAAKSQGLARPAPPTARDDVLDIGELVKPAGVPAPRRAPAVTAPDDFSRFGIEGLALA